MEWKKTPESLVKFFEEKTANLKCERRKMFGYPCCFLDGNMFIGTFGENLILRLGPKQREAALSTHRDMAIFEPVPGRKMKEYVLVPKKLRDNQATFDQLLDQSVKYAGSLPAKAAGKGPPKNPRR